MRSATKILLLRVAFVVSVICLYCTRGLRGNNEEKEAPSAQQRNELDDQLNAPSIVLTPEVGDVGRTPGFECSYTTSTPSSSSSSPSFVSGHRQNQQTMIQLPDLFRYQTEWNEGNYNIFLLESSCGTKPNYRVWCAVESLAQQNPGANVWYIMTSSKVNVEDGLVPDLLRQYNNLRIVTADLLQVFTDTPLEDVYTSGAWRRNNTWPEINLADIMRLALVWKLGGLYADSDFVCIRPLSHLTNMIAWQEGFTLGSGVFHFTRWHPVMETVMEHIKRDFQPEKWGSSGPIVFTKILKDMCGGKAKVSGDKCSGISLLPMKTFYPIPNVIWKTLFMPQAPRDVRKRYPSSFMIHCWNQLSYDVPIVKSSGCIYDEAAAVFCPLTRSFATLYSNTY